MTFSLSNGKLDEFIGLGTCLLCYVTVILLLRLIITYIQQRRSHFVSVVDLFGIFKAKIKVLVEFLWTPRGTIISFDKHISIAFRSEIVILNLIYHTFGVTLIVYCTGSLKIKFTHFSQKSSYLILKPTVSSDI